MKQLIVVAVFGILLPLQAQEKDAKITISLRAFQDIVVEPAGVAEVLATAKGEVLTPAERSELRMKIPSRIIALWLDAERMLLAEAKGEKEHAFPPALADAIKEAEELPIKLEHLGDSLTRLLKLSEAVATPGDSPEKRKITVSRAWVDSFFTERNALVQRMIASGKLRQPGHVAGGNGQPTFARADGGQLKKIADASVPEEGDVIAAPFGKDGTWNVYRVITRPVLWLEAEMEAAKTASPVGDKAVKGHLVSIGSYAENQFLVRMLRGVDRAWIGLNDRRLEAGSDGEGTWEWTSGEPVTFRNWVPAEPNSASTGKPPFEEDGTAILWNNAPDKFGRWSDYPDGTSARSLHYAAYVIEWNLNAPAPPEGAKQLPAALPAKLKGPEGGDDTWGVRVVYDCKDCSSLLRALETYESGAGRVVETSAASIHFHEPDGHAFSLLFPDASPLPEQRTGIDKKVAFLARGKIRVVDAGRYTFGITHDDGFALRIKDVKWKSATGNGVIDPGDASTLVHYWHVGSGMTHGVAELPAGDHEIEFFGFQGEGDSYFELYSAKGEFAERDETDEWRLVGHKSLGKIAIPGVTKDGWAIETLAPGGLTKIAYDTATRTLDRRGVKSPERVKVLNYFDPDHSWGPRWPWLQPAATMPFPGGEAGKFDKDFALRARATLEIPADGVFQIGYRSRGGGRLSIGQEEWKRIALQGPVKGEIDLEFLDHNPDSKSGSRVVGEIALKAGTYPIEYLSIHGGISAVTSVTGGIPTLPQIFLRAGAAKVIDDHDGLRLVK